MDQFQDGQHVWLRSRVQGTYLHADKDGYGVSLSSRRMSMKAAWSVHLYYGNHQQVLLHSAAYGRYLSTTDAPAPLGCWGFRVALHNYENLDDVAIRWEPLKIGAGPEILLRHDREDDVYGYLRANGRYNLLNANEVSVDGFNYFSTMMEWLVQPIPSRERIPRLPRPIGPHLSILLSSRMMMFTFGEVLDIDDFAFSFKGRSVFRLRKKLAIKLGFNEDVPDNLVMYFRTGTFGRLTPLVVNLPRSTQSLVITADTLANGGPRVPGFRAVTRAGLLTVALKFTSSEVSPPWTCRHENS